MTSIPKICLCSRLPLPIALLLALLFGAPLPIRAQTPEQQLDALLARARQDGDVRSERRISNLRAGLALLKPSQLQAIQCGKGASGTFQVVESEIAKDTAGELLTKVLEKVAPTLAAALASAPAAGIAAFLTPETIGADPVEMLNSSGTRERAEVQNAARIMLQATRPEAFQTLPPPLMAKIIACAI